MVNPEIEKQLHLREMELTSLLEITQAINSNLPEESLYKIYHFTTIASLHIKKLALYVQDTEWSCKVNYGTEKDYKTIQPGEKVLGIKSISQIENSLPEFGEFEIIIPIAHKDKSLAYVFLSGDHENAITDTSFVQTFTSILIVAIENKKLARKELQQEALRKELEIAREVQTMLFPKELPYTSNLKMHATYLPHLSVGGDYYDYIRLDDHKFVVGIADVSGKGIPASLLMSNFQASLRTLIRQTTDLKEIIHELNFVIKNNAKGERFITFFIALFDLENKSMRYINAGHNPPILVKGNKKMEILEKGTTVLGAFDKLPFIEEEVIKLDNSTLLFAYTDGLTETSNEKEEEFGLNGIQGFLEKRYSKDIKEIHSELHAKLVDFKGKKNFPDDITYLTCRIS
ncbi:MAG: PP2C family protein-serine/threonine phosphatase [Cytophagaceae bacterium]|nr:PP2C family protein-serine/threonine phosphatase [Cytophagaceae bacterium]